MIKDNPASQNAINSKQITTSYPLGQISIQFSTSVRHQSNQMAGGQPLPSFYEMNFDYKQLKENVWTKESEDAEYSIEERQIFHNFVFNQGK